MQRRLGCLVACLPVMLLSAAGVADARVATAKGPIQVGNGDCGANEPGDPVVGTVSFRRRDASKVLVTVRMDSGEPDTKYDVALFGNECHIVSELATLTTNAKGEKKESLTFVVREADQGDTEFFVDLLSPLNEQNSTPYVALP